VASIDGVAADRTRPRSSKDISKGDAGDRFVMGLLRAAADVVVIGAGTLRAHTSGAWTPARAFPAASDQFSALRVEWELPASPRLAIVSATGHLPDHPSLDGAMMFTTSGGFRRLSSHAARFADVFVLPDGPAGVDLRRVVDILRAQGLDRILTEGGPGLMSALLRARVVDQLFLTLSPVVAGRDPGSDRPGIVDGLAFDPACFRQARLLSLRRGGSFVFLRYELETSIGEREAS
jgi:riboflavin biosynthesis pyrimidine reductase